MPLEIVTEAPKSEDFTPLSEHQEETPSTFFSARAVLHHFSPGARLLVRKSEYEQTEALLSFPPAPDSAEPGQDAESEDVKLEADVWVTSRYVMLYSTGAATGVRIDYPSIGLHALGAQDGRAAVYVQLDMHDRELTNDEEDMQTLTLNIVPAVLPEPAAQNGGTAHANGDSNSEARPGPALGTGSTAHANGHSNAAALTGAKEAKALFEALSACADLNPDPVDEDGDEAGDAAAAGLQEPGAGGWITSENMHEFMDAQGNWTGPELPVLGTTAGQVRQRGEDEEGEGEGEDREETKWQRTG